MSRAVYIEATAVPPGGIYGYQYSVLGMPGGVNEKRNFPFLHYHVFNALISLTFLSYNA